MPTRLLVLGDIHLGRQSSRLPDRLDAEVLGPEAALRQAVQAGLQHQISAVLLAGDIADSDRDQYHALGVLTGILGPLAEAGVEVLAVAGNHDHEVLPRLARAVPGLHLLGAGGRWETREVLGPGGPVRVLGWSFPGPLHAQSPAVGLERLPPGPPVIGLLHADLGAVTSRYAPVRATELAQAGPCRWLLGHVHQPSLDPHRDEPGYLGSLVGLDPTETGARGPWLVEVTGQDIALRFLPQAPLRWESLTLDVEAMASPREELPALVAGAMRTFAAEFEGELAATTAVGLRLRLEGRAARFGDLAAAVAELQREPPVLEIAPGLTGFVDRVDNGARPLHDLTALAERDDPPGLLARELLALQQGQADDLLQAAQQAAQKIDRNNSYRALTTAGTGDEAPDLTESLLGNGYQILDDLLHGRKDADGTA